jgi:hypothetical protein
MKKNGYSFDYIDDRDGTLAKKYKISVFPTTIICHNEKVKYIEVGYTSTLGLYLKLWFFSFL